MKQLLHDRATGRVDVLDVPEPALRGGTLLVRTAWSAVSPGTERNAVQVSRQGLLRTARARPDLVRKVLDTVRREGLRAAYDKVQARRQGLEPLGYSSAGIVIAVDSAVGDEFMVGDRVACAGSGHASHAEVACVPAPLVSRVPDGVPLEEAAFTTLGAIALHAVRQAEPTLGERFAVIGLGLVGQLAVQVLRAAGCRVIGFDSRPDRVDAARACGAEARATVDVDEQVFAALEWTDGVGVDGVIVAAASSTDAPMAAAAGACRDRGRVVAVGLVPHALPRDVAYAKELDLRISRSYGPGRYDVDFEERGRDLPMGYVRWTETRNMAAFLDLLADGRVRTAPLVTHRMRLDDAPAAYDKLLDARSGALGVLIEHPGARAAATAAPPQRALHIADDDAAYADDVEEPPRLATAPAPAPAPASLRPTRTARNAEVGVGLLGAGFFARGTLLPMLAARRDVRLRWVATAHGHSALDARRRFGFEEIGTDVDAVLADSHVDLACIATRHDQHADFAIRSLRAGKHVFVEKPLALRASDLDRIETMLQDAPGLLMVGFNRRFSPHARALREEMAGRGPLLMVQRVNAPPLPQGHWLDDPDVGGGRLVGEGCHFVDLLSFLCGDPEIVAVEARAPGSTGEPPTDFALQVAFADGSLGQLLYTSHGSPALPKERLEVHGGGVSAILDDYTTCTVYRGRKRKRIRGEGKGHAEEIQAVLDAVRAGGPSPIPWAVLRRVTQATLDAQRLLRSREPAGEAQGGAEVATGR